MKANKKRLFLLFVLTFLGFAPAAKVARAQDLAKNSTEKANPILPAASEKTAIADRPAAPEVPVVPVDYVVGEADTLNISVWKERDLSQTAAVRPDGKISFPLLNEIKVSGMTPVQVQAMLEEQLKKYIMDPHVTVTVTEIRSRVVYITGEVAKPGAFSLVGPLNVFQLIAKANGLTTYAKRNKILVLRQVDGRQVRLPFHYDQVVRGRNSNENIELRPGDTVVVP